LNICDTGCRLDVTVILFRRSKL